MLKKDIKFNKLFIKDRGSICKLESSSKKYIIYDYIYIIKTFSII